MTMERSGIGSTLNRLVGHIRLRLEARRHKFPVWIKNKYIYGCYCWMGRPMFHRWRDHMRGLGLRDDDIAPLRGDGDVIATYRLVRSYRDSGPRGSDYAAGDSGNVGDFKLARIDRVPNDLSEGSDEG